MRAAVVGLLLASCGFGQTVDFQRDIKSILETNCLACHGPIGPAAGGLRLHTRTAAAKIIVAGKPEQSPLYVSLEIPAGKPGAMPPGEQLPKAQRALIQKWIAEGAAWPESMVLTKAAKGATDEMATVRALHQRITAKAGAKAAGK